MAGTGAKTEDHLAIRFPGWKDALAAEPIDPGLRERHRRAVFGFLKHCKEQRTAASVASIRAYLAITADVGAREALRWFFKASRAASPAPAGTRPSDRRVPAVEVVAREAGLAPAQGEPVRFPGWKAVLARAEIEIEVKESHRRAIISFLKHCKELRAPATVERVRHHLAAHPQDRDGLRWFFRAAAEARTGSEENDAASMRAVSGPSHGASGHGDVPTRRRARHPDRQPGETGNYADPAAASPAAAAGVVGAASHSSTAGAPPARWRSDVPPRTGSAT